MCEVIKIGLEFVKAEVQEYEMQNPFPAKTDDQYNWWINCIGGIKERLFSDVCNLDFDSLD